MRKINLLLLLLFSTLFSNSEFKYGIGISNVSAPLYIGSKKQKRYTIPFPYISLKSKYLNIKRSRIFSNIYDSKNSKIELSLSALPPVRSEKSLRDGMKDLDAILQVGPKYSYTIFENRSDLKFEIPLRLAFSIGDELFYYKGYIADINFRYSRPIWNDFKFTYITGFSYNSKQINRYYYEVTKSDETLNRKVYAATSGYSGFHNSIAFTKKRDHYWMGLFLRHYYLKGVSFETSPLYENDEAVYLGAAISYIF